MNIVFAGTPAFAATALEALLAAGYPVSLVLTQPDRPAGRGMKPVASAVKNVALAHGLPLYQPERLRTPEQQAPLRDVPMDVMVVAAYGLILPQAVLDMPRLGCVNIHASLLPRWRGAAPVQRAIAAGDSHTGITLMQMDAGLDTGPMLSTHVIDIRADDTSDSLLQRLTHLGAQAIVDALPQLTALQGKAQPQPADGVTYAEKIRKEEGRLDWRRPAAELARQLRAFTPFPGLQSVLAGQTLKVWQADAAGDRVIGTPGRIVAVSADGITVACGVGSLCIRELQRPGSRRMTVADFLAGHPLQPGEQFELPVAD